MAIGVSHCGAGCVLGTSARIHGRAIWASPPSPSIKAFAILFRRRVFQYCSIAPMSGGLFPSAPVQADILSLTGFEV